MAGQVYSTVAGRLENFAGAVLARAQFSEMLCKLGDTHEMPANKSQKITFLRYLPFGGVDNQFIAAGGDTTFVNQHLVAESVTPPASSISYTTLYTTLKQIGCLFSYSDVTFDTHEEGKAFPEEMQTQVAERLTLCREYMCYGTMKACTNAFFGGTGTTIDTVNGPVTRDMAQKVERSIKGKHGFTLNKMLGPGQGLTTHPVPASFPAYVHTDYRRTLENTTGFTKVENYGGRPLLDEDNEIGSLGSLRFIENPILTYIPNGGAAVGTWTGNGSAKSTGASLMDVYPIIVMGRGKAQGGAFGQVALRGKNAIKVTHVPLGQTDKCDPLGQRGYIGGLTWQAQLIENDAWMAVLYVGCQD
jgi:N4-gp56 family major capsid protein